MASEVGLVANMALRCALRTTTSRIQPCARALTHMIASSSARPLSTSTLSSSMRSLSNSNGSLSQRRHASGWSAPDRAIRPKTVYDDASISKPTGPTTSSDPSMPREFKPTSSTRMFGDPNDLFDSISAETGYGDLTDMEDFSSRFNFGELSNPNKANEPLPKQEQPRDRLVPRLGRTVHVSKGADVARSFKLLNMQCAANRVRQEFQYQRYHERAGLKRKRLKSERWQRRFKKGFRATCDRVSELRRQGW
ncbi:uncharacterized protein BCR38DRAFT_431068 [Pseudomassariella vexata]|uniref:Uncharacterized protein n=1 Tax=Pseudomassariella vexata TaxID=1141098 RepID=A0A1Y2DZV0_9PEZI|nr:uncharacterized protein BCR38DRAFT_431068 [Pseudomassariella vexata]ORY64813.1 hypothetical protein BCR38DRAFT_431068 [Pseudomassariella vexata]